MNVEHVEILVEEPSMEAALRVLLPKILVESTFEVYPYSCKSELLQRLADRLRGYARWLPKDWRIVVIVDRDDQNCSDLKRHLEETAAKARLLTRSVVEGTFYAIVNRLAIEELEAWYFGYWAAVRAAFPNVSATIPLKAPYRNPDAIAGGTWEAFERVLQRAGYFGTGLRKIEVARAVAQHMKPERNTSRSFRVFWKALDETERA